MNELFLKILNMSIAASWLVLAVLILRLVLKKAPKWVSVLLWGIVAVRLLCPFSIECALSLIPSTETIPLDIEMDWTPAIDSGINAVNSVINPVIAASFTPHPAASANPLQIWIPLASILWITGMAAMLLYTVISYCCLRRKVSTAVLYKENIYQSEHVGSPFVLGIIKPRVYLPFRLDGQDLMHVVAHEQAHIRRKDHLWKPLGFLLLSVHWFNPLIWLAYSFLCRDIELACDEKVIKELGSEQRADYTQALLTCSIHRRSIAACPLAFGEVGVKERVKSVMNYKKPAFWVIVAAVIVCVVAALCFLTDPIKDDSPGEVTPDSITFEAELLEIHDGYYLVRPEESWERNSSDLLEVPMQKLDPALEPQVGDIIEIACSGEILETYPARLREVYSIRVINETTTLSLNHVIILSQYGYDLGWSDFEQYDYTETGSGLYIRVYEINELFELWIGGAGPDSDPMYIYLALADDIDTRIDIRDGGVTEFISKCGSTETAFTLNFAGNTSLQHKMELTAEKPFWCIDIVNEGSYVIVVELAGDVYKVEPGTSDTIYADEKWKPGTYSVSLASTVPNGMEGSAVCRISPTMLTGEGSTAISDN